MTRTTKLFAFLFLLVLVPRAHAQVSQAAVGSRPQLWGGVELSDFDPDYNENRVYGVGFYGDYYVSRHLGAEAEVRLLDFNQPFGLIVKSFLAGPTYTFYRHRKLSLYGKGLLGIDKYTYPFEEGFGTYFAVEPGGGVEYRLLPRWKVRGEYDYQFVVNAPGFPNFPSNGLTPNGFSVGVSYRIF